MSTLENGEGEIKTDQQGAVLLIGINRPDRANAFTTKMVLELSEAFERLENDASVNCAVLYGLGKNFTGGVQLEQIKDWFAAGKHVSDPGKIDPFDLFHPLRSKPVVAAVHGACFTIGLELMLAADIVIAAEDAKFGQFEVTRGLFANHGGALRIVERAGWGNAMRYLLTGESFDAATAYRLGLVQEITESGGQLKRAVELAEIVARQAPLAVRTTLDIARKGVLYGWPAAIAELGPAQRRLMESEDGQEGLRSFAERRPPAYIGR